MMDKNSANAAVEENGIKRRKHIYSLMKEAAEIQDELKKLDSKREKEKKERPQMRNNPIPQKSEMMLAAILNAISLVLIISTVILIVSLSSIMSKRKAITSVANDFGEEYEAWLDSWPQDPISYEDLPAIQDGWSNVQEAFAKRGVIIDWETYQAETFSGIYCTKEHAKNDLRFYLLNDILDELTMPASIRIMLLILNGIAILVFLIQGLKRTSEIVDYHKAYKEYLIIKEENENEYPIKLAEYEKVDAEREKRYEETYQPLKTRLESILFEVSDRTSVSLSLLPPEDLRIIVSKMQGGNSLSAAIEEIKKERKAERERIEREREIRLRESLREDEIRRRCERCRHFNTCTAKYRPDCPGDSRW